MRVSDYRVHANSRVLCSINQQELKNIFKRVVKGFMDYISVVNLKRGALYITSFDI